MEESLDTNSELTVEKITELALPKETLIQEAFDKAELPTNISDFKPLQDYFGVTDVDRKTQEQLQNVWEYFSRDTKDPGTVLKKIKAQQMNLAQPSIGDTRLNQLNNYVRILQQLNTVKDMKEAYEQ